MQDNRKELEQYGINADEEVTFSLVVRGSKLLVAKRLHEFAKYVRRGIPFGNPSPGVTVSMVSGADEKARLPP